MLNAFAKLKGSTDYLQITGIVEFFQKSEGTIVRLEIKGLPQKDKNNFFGLHIHEFGICNSKKGNGSFLDAGSHLDLEENKHPNHSGDLPTILSNNGYAYMEFFTNRFKVKDIIGKSVIIHEMKDDFMTEPSGNSGNRIACGVIEKYYS